MKRILAIARLTLKSAFRFRLVQVLIVLLLFAVLVLPPMIKHDSTARGFVQIILTYTLGAITTLLGLATLWLACGTLARDVDECQIQMVAVKPIARWQIWLGKWVGILLLNGLLLTLAGAAVYFQMQWRAGQLPAEAQAQLRSEILVARGSERPPINQAAIDAEVERQLAERLKEAGVATMDRTFVRKQIQERVLANFQIVPPGNARRWSLDLGSRAASLKGRPLQLRYKFFTPEQSSGRNYFGVWEIGPVDGRRLTLEEPSLAADSFYEMALPPDMLDDRGVLHVDFQNFNEMALLFPLTDGIEVLYPESGFGMNFIRGLGVVFCWLALLALLGLATASSMSFPVAAFVSLALLLMALSSGTVRQVVEEGGVTPADPNSGLVDNPRIVDRIALPIFKGMLHVLDLVQGFSPIDSLSSGRSVTWGQLGRAVFQIVIVVGGLLAAIGIGTFARRELATAQAST